MCITDTDVDRAVDEVREHMGQLGTEFSPADLLASTGISQDAGMRLFSPAIRMIDPPLSQVDRVGMALTMLIATLALAIQGEHEDENPLDPDAAIGDDYFDGEFLRELGIDETPGKLGEE